MAEFKYAHAPQANGLSHPARSQQSQLEASQIVQALEAIYDPRSSNETRIAATTFLDDAKRHPQAPTYGPSLASNRSNSSELRHYGLQMLEYSIRYYWETFSDDQRVVLRDSVIALALDVRDQDAAYIRNKIAQLWVETAKRSWALTWWNMDEILVRLWSTSLVHQGIVLYVLETLSEETFNREDPAVSLRGNDLGQACVEIFTPAAVLAEHFPTRETSADLRYGSEGWLQRICDLLSWCIANDPGANESVKSTAIRCLTALRTIFGWIMFPSLAAVQIISHLRGALSVANLEVQTSGIEAMLAIFARSSFRDQDFVSIVDPMFTSDSVSLLQQLYEYTITNAEDIDDAKYSLNKKVSELFSYLGSLLEQRLHVVTPEYDLTAYFKLLFAVMRNPSLLVSIPVLHVWTKFLRSRVIRDSPVMMECIAGLLEICSHRLVRYEHLPEDSTDETFLFLNEDIDTIPERHAFLGNYRRYCNDVVEVVVKKLPVEAINHILQQAMSLFEDVAKEQANFQPQGFSKTSSSVLRIDAQITVIDAAMKGYLKWLAAEGTKSQAAHQVEGDRNALQNTFQQCGQAIMGMKFNDPEIRRKITTLLVNISTKPLHDRPSFASTVLDYLMQPTMADDSSLMVYSDAVKALLTLSMQETNRLAMAFPDHFLAMYDELSGRIGSLLADSRVDDRLRVGYHSFLFIIVHRSSGLSPMQQRARLKSILDPMQSAWQGPELSSRLGNFPQFCDLLGMNRLGEYVTSHQFNKIQDWPAHQLDADGKALQAEIQERCHDLPLRFTKNLLAASTEKIEDKKTPQWEMACTLWADLIPAILPNLLHLVSFAQAFNDMQSWSTMPEEIQRVMQRMLTDRFWQAGISTESRDAFFTRVSNSKSSYEGFASTVRGTVRHIRETCYWILFGLIRFRESFYSIPDLTVPLSRALFEHADGLSSHHFSVLLNLVVQLIEGCPSHLRRQFLPQLIVGLFLQLDRKIGGEWDLIKRRNDEQTASGGNLSEEMKDESILRQLTYTAVSLAHTLLDSHRPEPSEATVSGSPGHVVSPGKGPRMHSFILTSPFVLEPILVFLKNAIGFCDTRACCVAIRALRATIPLLPLSDLHQGPLVRRFLSEDLLKSAITSLHEPYFIDVQKELASLIAQVLIVGCVSGTEEDIARNVLLSLPGLSTRADKVDLVLAKLRRGNGSSRAPQMSDKLIRALVLDLLKGVRGQSIQEIGRIVPDRAAASPLDGSGKPKKPARSKMQEQFMMSIDEGPSAGGIGQGDEDGLIGVADMFQ